MAISIGQQLGNYRLVSLLGQGGFADVYLAEHIHLGTQVAIKVLNIRLTNNNIEHFRNEARTIAHLVHPHILRVLDFGIEDNIPYLVMDYALNGTLRHRHPKGSILPLDTIVLYVKQIALALQFVHDHKLIHRDMKPENLLIGRDNEILISDFGIAVAAHNTHSLSTQDGSGTIYYIAPEQIQGKPRTTSDQYALGIIVYEWLCGVPPFTGTAMEIGMQHLLTSPPPLREKLPMISSEVEQVVLTALAKDPHQRFASVQAFANALEQAGQPSIGTPIYTYSGHSGEIRSLMWSLDSIHIATMSVHSQSLEGKYLDGMVQIWHSSKGNKIYSYSSDLNPILSVIWKSNILYIASAESKYEGTVQIFNTITEQPVITFRQHFSRIDNMLWSPNGMLIATEIGSVRAFWNGYEYEAEGYCVGSVEVRDTATGIIVNQYELHGEDEYITLAWSPDSTCIAFSLDIGAIYIWRVTVKNEVFTYWGHNDCHVSVIAWSPNGKRIASVGDDCTVQVWNAANGEYVCSYCKHSDPIHDIAWSPDGKRIVSAGGISSGLRGDIAHSEGSLHIWDSFTGENFCTYRSQSGVIQKVAWSPDGRRIAATFEDQKVRVWQVL